MKTIEEKLKMLKNERLHLSFILKEFANGNLTKKDFIKKMVNVMKVTDALIDGVCPYNQH